MLYPPCAARFLIDEAAAKRGAELRLSAAVTQMGQGRVQLADGVEIRGQMVVNAAGAWSPELTGAIEIKKRKGHLVITDRYPGFLRHQLVELGYLKSAHSVSSDSVAFNVQPRRTGQILIGSSRQYGAGHKEVDQKSCDACCNARRNICQDWDQCLRCVPGLDSAQPRPISCR